jgi:hypothetical protein
VLDDVLFADVLFEVVELEDIVEFSFVVGLFDSSITELFVE